MTATAHPLRQKYTRSHIKRTTTCPGCGIGTVSQAILRAIDELQLPTLDQPSHHLFLALGLL